MEEDGTKVDRKAHHEANDHGDRHELSEVVDDLGEIEESGEMKGRGGDESDVEARQGVASVGECFVVERGDGETWRSKGG